MTQLQKIVDQQAPFKNTAVANRFAAYPNNVREKLLLIRQLIFTVATETEGVGVLQEDLKWGQPSFLTAQSKSGSTIRIDQFDSRSDVVAVFFHCQTSLVDTFKEIYGNTFNYEGNRAIVFRMNDQLPLKALSHCIQMALTYHSDKRKRLRGGD